MNAMNAPSKRSTLEKKLDKLIITIFCVLLTMCLIGAIGWYGFSLILSLSSSVSIVEPCFVAIQLYILLFCSSIVTDREDLYLGLQKSDWEYRNRLAVIALFS